jgi:hypothetical protein
VQVQAAQCRSCKRIHLRNDLVERDRQIAHAPGFAVTCASIGWPPARAMTAAAGSRRVLSLRLTTKPSCTVTSSAARPYGRGAIGARDAVP